jgi:hypothetical protein
MLCTISDELMIICLLMDIFMQNQVFCQNYEEFWDLYNIFDPLSLYI